MSSMPNLTDYKTRNRDHVGASRAIAIVISKMLWIATAVGAAIGAVLLVSAFVMQQSAPQQGAAGAMAAAAGILPYVFARAWDELAGHPSRSGS
jgi:hypothetical protein